MDGTGELFQPFLAAAKNEFSAIVIRYPTDRLLDYAALTALVSSQFPTNERFVLLAESFSGPIAVTLAASKPKGLSGLVLCATFARNPRPKLGCLIPLFSLLPLSWVPARVISYFFLGRFATTELRDDLKRVLGNVDRSVISKRLRSIIEVNVTNELQQIDVPLLYLMASEDRLVTSNTAIPFERLRNCRITKITGPHLLVQSVPREVAIALRTFLNRCDETRRM